MCRSQNIQNQTSTVTGWSLLWASVFARSPRLCGHDIGAVRRSNPYVAFLLAVGAVEPVVVRGGVGDGRSPTAHTTWPTVSRPPAARTHLSPYTCARTRARTRARARARARNHKLPS